jgi:hypothetical protein
MHQISRTAALAATLAALAAPAAHAQGPSPDARDTASGWTGGRPYQNLASPDARDAAQGRGTFNAPEVTILKVPQQQPVAQSGGVDWTDVGIGAGAVLGIVLLAGGGTALVARRRELVVR